MGLEQEHEAGVGRAGPAEELGIQVGLGQAVQPEEGPAVHPGAQVGDEALPARINPAADPGFPRGERPVGRMDLDCELPAGGFRHGSR